MERGSYKIRNVLNMEAYVPSKPQHLPAILHGVTDEETTVCAQSVISIVIEMGVSHVAVNMRVLLSSG
jgi:hypothetical protein